MPDRRPGGFRCAEEEDDLPRGHRAPRGRATGCCRCAGRRSSRPTREWAMLVATYAKQGGRVVAYSMAAFRQAFAAGRDLGDRDTVLIAAAAAEMHPAAVIKGAGAARARGAAGRRRPRPPARPASATCRRSASATGCSTATASWRRRRRWRGRREGEPRVRADRAARRPRPGARSPTPTASTRSRSSRSPRARSCSSGTRRRRRPAASRARCKADLAQLEADEFLRRWRRWRPS